MMTAATAGIQLLIRDRHLTRMRNPSSHVVLTRRPSREDIRVMALPRVGHL